MLVGRFLSRSLCNAIGYAYPIYMSVKVASKGDEAVEEQIQWVVFWTVNACFSVFEIIADCLGNYIPLYYEAKVCMMAWLALPYFRGATKIYERLVAPYFVKWNRYEQSLDASIDLASDKLSQLCREAAALAIQKGSGAIVQGQQYIVMQAMQQAWAKPLSPKESSREPAPPTEKQTPSADPTPPATPVPTPNQDTSTKAQATQSNAPMSRQDKEAELLMHFRMLLSRGLKVRLGSKSRLLRLNKSGTHLYLESKALRGAASPVVMNLIFIQSIEAKEDSRLVIETTSTHSQIILEAEAKKTRDLLVAGLRLLILAFHKNSTKTLERLAILHARHKMQFAFDSLLDNVNRANLRRNF
ncbi:hypothetical protein THRCLA_21763 [Thraustotheca clavata]|uniref:Receptor expression-enhancing protein n=1 Tax=Thraustotheca clavata TaxID=74557 RepID=A0A1V9ZQ45_9STRA|nr:hypothetical protein THRCLA_21763 [Thraustotheca clavata]